MNDFLSLLPFQEGDKVKDKDGNIFIIEPYQYANEAWGIDYFSLEKAEE